MAAGLQPFAYDPLASRQPYGPNPYGAYFPLPIPVGAQLPVTVFAQPDTGQLPEYRSVKPGTTSHKRPSRPSQRENRHPRHHKRADEAKGTQAKHKPLKKLRRKPWKKAKHLKLPAATGIQPIHPLREQVRMPTPQPTPYSSRHFLEDAAALNVNPYGTMAGVIELREGTLEDGLQEARREHSSSVDGPSTTSSSSEGGRQGDDGHQGDDGRQEQQASLATDAVQPLLDFQVAMLQDPSRQGEGFLRARLEEQEAQIHQLEEDNLNLREKLFLVQQELEELKRRASASSAEKDAVEGENSVVWGGPCES